MSSSWLGSFQRAGPAVCGIILAASMSGQQQSVAAQGFDAAAYARNVSLDPNLDVFWTVDTEAATIRVALHAKAASGWAGVGISEMGGMEGADILFYEVATGNVTDAHSLVAGVPITDECTQDWTLLSAEVGNGTLVFEVERALDTGDTQDRVFTDDSGDGTQPTRLIAAWGDTESISNHQANVAKGEVILFGGPENADAEPLAEVKSSPEVLHFDVTAKNFTIPAQRTWYEDTCIPASELPNLGEYSAMGFEGLIQNETAKHVHHLVVTGWGTADCWDTCDRWLNEMLPTSESSSYSSSPSDSSSPSGFSSFTLTLSSYIDVLESQNMTLPSFCTDNMDIFPWAPGSADLVLPADVGFAFGNASGGIMSVSLNTHYDNPDGIEGMVDSSGVRVYYEEEPRPVEMGVIRLGDPHLALTGLPLPDGKSGFSFDCPSSCTDEQFEAEEVTVVSHFLHMHENGRRMETRQYRNDNSGNEVLVHSAEAEYYSFEQAGGFLVTSDDTVTIQRGDRFVSECFYDTSDSSEGSANVVFGEGSEMEMCVDYVFYYPNQKLQAGGACGLAACGGSLQASAFDADSDFNRTFGVVDTCTTDVPGELEGEDSSSSARVAMPVLSATAALVLGSGTLVFGMLLV